MKTHGHSNAGDIDRLIDAAAADMTSAVLSSGFASRVMANLDRGPGIDLRRIATGIAAAAAVALALWLPGFGTLDPSNFPDVREAPAPAGNEAARQSVPTHLPTAAIQRKTRRAQVISADEAAWLSRSVPPLSAAPAIAIDAIQPERSVIAPISVQPLVSEPIELTPLVNPSQPNGGR